MTTPGFTAEASLHKTTIVDGDRQAQPSAAQIWGSEVAPASLPWWLINGGKHGGCRCERYGPNGRCEIYLC
jgi:hypothetical protein